MIRLYEQKDVFLVDFGAAIEAAKLFSVRQKKVYVCENIQCITCIIFLSLGVHQSPLRIQLQGIISNSKQD